MLFHNAERPVRPGDDSSYVPTLRVCPQEGVGLWCYLVIAASVGAFHISNGEGGCSELELQL